jgi:hypothetical protein
MRKRFVVTCEENASSLRLPTPLGYTSDKLLHLGTTHFLDI